METKKREVLQAKMEESEEISFELNDEDLASISGGAATIDAGAVGGFAIRNATLSEDAGGFAIRNAALGGFAIRNANIKAE